MKSDCTARRRDDALDTGDDTMARYRDDLPQLSNELFLTDAGLETILIFHDGLELPHFASIGLMTREEGRDRLARYYSDYAELGRERGMGVVLDTPTWRASHDWGELLGHDDATLRDLNIAAVEMLQEVRDRFDGGPPIVISGCVGPKGDGYDPAHLLTADDAEAYHGPQIAAFASSRADLVSALTMTHTGEAIGVARAARAAGVPVAIYFTVETDGRLPSGEPLGEAIERVDGETGAYPVHFGINCAHPTHFETTLAAAAGEPWLERVRAVRANASCKSHAELDEATELDDGNPAEFGAECIALRRLLPKLNVLGGCCGTDQRHIEAIAQAS